MLFCVHKFEWNLVSQLLSPQILCLIITLLLLECDYIQFYLYHCRSVDFMRRPGKDLNSYNMGSSSELEGPIPQSVVSTNCIGIKNKYSRVWWCDWNFFASNTFYSHWNWLVWMFEYLTRSAKLDKSQLILSHLWNSHETTHPYYI